MGMNHFKKRRCVVQPESVWFSSVRFLSIRLDSACLGVQCERGLIEAEICGTRDGDEKCIQNDNQKAISKEITGDVKIVNSILLKWIIQKQDVGMRTTLVWLRKGIDGTFLDR